MTTPKWQRHPSQTVRCQYCGKPFKAYYTKLQRGLRKYCCPEHGFAARRERVSVKLVCTQCGKEFTRPRYRVKKGVKPYCCPEHRALSRRVANKGYTKGKKCIICGKPIQDRSKRFCKEHQNAGVRKGKVKLVCPVCGKQFERFPSQVQIPDPKCSYDCAAQVADMFGKGLVCSDGHVAQSRLEYLVDEWLTEHGLEHSPHPHLPWHPRKCADFLVDGIYVEVWGLVGFAVYDKKMAIKLAEYHKHGVKVLSVYPDKIYNGNFSELEILLQGE